MKSPRRATRDGGGKRTRQAAFFTLPDRKHVVHTYWRLAPAAVLTFTR